MLFVLKVIGFIALAVFAFFAIMLVIALMISARALRKARIIASETACPHCDEIFGEAAVTHAMRDSNQAIRDLHAEQPDKKQKIVIVWNIKCPDCGKKTKFHPGTQSLVDHAKKQKTVDAEVVDVDAVDAEEVK